MTSYSPSFWFASKAEATSHFFVATFPDSLEGTDRYWDVIVSSIGAANACRWNKDICSLNRQIMPHVLSKAMAAGADVGAMMTMHKIDRAAIEAVVAVA